MTVGFYCFKTFFFKKKKKKKKKTLNSAANFSSRVRSSYSGVNISSTGDEMQASWLVYEITQKSPLDSRILGLIKIVCSVFNFSFFASLSQENFSYSEQSH